MPEVKKNRSNFFTLKRLKITPKLFLIFGFVVALPLFVVGYLSLQSNSESALLAGQKSMLQKNNAISLNIENLTNTAVDEIYFLKDIPPIQGIIRAREQNFDSLGNSSLETWINRLNAVFVSLAENKTIYPSIIYADQNGKIITQVDYYNENARILSPYERESVNTSETFIETMQMPQGQCFISSLKTELQRFGLTGKIELGLPVFDEHNQARKGALILILDANTILQKIESFQTEENQFFILNSENEICYQTGDESFNLENTGFNQSEDFFLEPRKSNYAWAYTTIIINEDTRESWKIFQKTNTMSMGDEVMAFLWRYVVWAIILFAISFLISYLFSKNLVKNLLKIRDSLVILGKGEHPEKVKAKTNDELGEMIMALNKVVDSLKKTSEFAQEIGKGKLDVEFKPLSNKDILGNSLLEMRNSLKKAEREDKKRRSQDEKQNWTTQGLAKFGEILRKNTDNIKVLSKNIVMNMVEYMEANQGALLIVNSKDENIKYLELVATVAYNRERKIKKRFELDEGMVGRVYEEKKSIYLTEIPQDYIDITSGLGSTNPGCLLIVPLKLNQEVFGVLELASFKEFEAYQINFVEKIGESIASTLSSVKVNERTASLLEQTRQQAEELSAQEEEMRQNIEELQTTQEEASKREAEMSSLLDAINATSLVCEFSTEGKFTAVSEQFLALFDTTRSEVIGHFHSEFHSLTKEKETYAKFWENLRKGKAQKRTSQIKINDNEFWVYEIYTPILDNQDKVVKILNLAIDITHSKKQEDELIEKTNTMQAQEEELKQSLEEFQTTQEKMQQESQEKIQQLEKEKQDIIEKYQQQIQEIKNNKNDKK